MGFALSRPKVLLHGLATAAAMLTCLAVVVNVGPFGKAPASFAGYADLGIPDKGLASSEPASRPIEAYDPVSEVSPALAGQVANEQPSGSRATTSESGDIARAEATDLSEATIALMRWTWFSPGEIASPAVHLPEQARPGDEPAINAARQAGSTGSQPTPYQANAEPSKIDPLIGVWAPDAGTCSARDFRDGALPTVINMEGAWAGETFCMFTNRQQIEAGWRVVAKCQSPRERWTSHVRLTVDANRLTWKSKRGTQMYTRCAPDVLMAQAR